MGALHKTVVLSALLALILSLPANLAGFPTIFIGSKAFAAVEDLKKQIEDKNHEIEKLEAEIKAFQGSIEEAESTAKTLKEAIARLDRQLKNLNVQISLTQTKIAKKVLEIKGLGVDIDDMASSIEERRKFLAKILETLSMLESDSVIERFFKYETVSGFFDELEKVKAIDQSIRENHEKLSLLKLDLENRKSQAEKVKKELQGLQRDLFNQKEIQEDNKDEKNNLLKATKNQEALYQKLLKDRERRRTEIYDEIRQIESELKKQIDLGTLPAFGKGILLSPIDGGAVTQEFGNTSFAKYTDVYKNGFHNGVDFRAQVGTPLRAAADGTVKAIGNTDLICPRGSYGKWILIEHPNKLTTLYAHFSIVKVDARQEVRRGDIIGYSGNTGYTTGPHLHFTVYDARTVQLRPSRVCGVLPYGGYLDPLSYL